MYVIDYTELTNKLSYIICWLNGRFAYKYEDEKVIIACKPAAATECFTVFVKGPAIVVFEAQQEESQLNVVRCRAGKWLHYVEKLFEKAKVAEQSYNELNFAELAPEEDMSLESLVAIM